MAKGRSIIVSSNPKGFFQEGIISGTPKPGTCMEKVPATTTVGGRFTYRAVTRADGAIGPIIILTEDDLQGKLGVSASAAYTGGPPAPGDAYVSGTRGFLYYPQAGEDFNMIVASVAGTADDVAIGDLFGVEQTSGKLKANNSFAATPFEANEVVTDPTADYMLWTTFRGEQA